MHSPFSQCIIKIKYAFNLCSWNLIEITTNNYIHPVTHLSDCPNNIVNFLYNSFSSTNFQLDTSFWVLLFFYPWVLFIAFSKCQNWKIFSCTVYEIGFSLDAEKQSFRSFCWSNYINFNWHCNFPFSAVPKCTSLSTNQ